MASTATPKSRLRLLTNAEPFGFGPTAAIADCFPYLREEFATIGYVGRGHTLSLQRKLPYDRLHNISGLSGPAESKELKAIFADYEVLLTAMDFTVAEQALKAGLTVCIYDALTWYWQTIPPVVRKCKYIAQDFFGVSERLGREQSSFKAPVVVPPIIAPATPQWSNRQKVLLNLGGLNNPYWSSEGTLAYARLIVESFRKSGVANEESTVIAANASLAQDLKEFGVTNLSRDEMQRVLSEARWALMTPGLGNIYDAGRYGTPTVWLPPANDSQGQQLQLLSQHGFVDGAIHWHDLVTQGEIDYREDQQTVLKQVAACVNQASACPRAGRKLVNLMAREGRSVSNKALGQCTALIFQFGSGGAKRVAELVAQHARKECRHV